MKEKKLQQIDITLTWNGIWNMYFEPIIWNYMPLSNPDDSNNTNVNYHDIILTIIIIITLKIVFQNYQ
jgi:hypothetical protein